MCSFANTNCCPLATLQAMANMVSALSRMGTDMLFAARTRLLMAAFDAHAVGLPPYYKQQVRHACRGVVDVPRCAGLCSMAALGVRFGLENRVRFTPTCSAFSTSGTTLCSFNHLLPLACRTPSTWPARCAPAASTRGASIPTPARPQPSQHNRRRRRRRQLCSSSPPARPCQSRLAACATAPTSQAAPQRLRPAWVQRARCLPGRLCALCRWSRWQEQVHH